MSEETMNFYQYNLEIWPEKGIVFAMAYVLKILNILLKHSPSTYVEMHKFITKTRKRFKIDSAQLKAYENKYISDIIKDFEDSCYKISEDEMKYNEKMERLQDMKQEPTIEKEEEKKEEDELPMNESIQDENENPQEAQETKENEEEEEDKEGEEGEENKEEEAETPVEEPVVFKRNYPLY